jgi:hypothetical protein
MVFGKLYQKKEEVMRALLLALSLLVVGCKEEPQEIVKDDHFLNIPEEAEVLPPGKVTQVDTVSEAKEKEPTTAESMTEAEIHAISNNQLRELVISHQKLLDSHQQLLMMHNDWLREHENEILELQRVVPAESELGIATLDLDEIDTKAVTESTVEPLKGHDGKPVDGPE